MALRERELELRALRAGAPAPSARETVIVSESESEDDARGLESPAPPAVCTRCKGAHGQCRQTGPNAFTKTETVMEDGFDMCVTCRRRVAEDEKKMAPLVNTAPRCVKCKKSHGDVVQTHEHGPLKTVLEGDYATCERCRLGVDKAAAAAKRRNGSGADVTMLPRSASVSTASCTNCGKRHGDVVHTREYGPLKTVLEGDYVTCERCRWGVDVAHARATRAGDVEGLPESKGKRQCQKCKRHAGPNLTNNGVRVVVCFAKPHDSTCIACKELERDTNSARPNAQSSGVQWRQRVAACKR